MPSLAEEDGRTARRDRNREAVLDAVLDLFRAGNLQPHPDQVAEASGISLRSVYRYYSDPAELLRAAMARHLEAVLPLVPLEDIGRGSFAERLDRFLDGRLRLYEVVAPTARATRLAATRNDVIRDQLDHTTTVLRKQVDAQFAAELEALPVATRKAIAAAVDALVQFEAVDYYRVTRRLGANETRELLRTALAHLLGEETR